MKLAKDAPKSAPYVPRTRTKGARTVSATFMLPRPVSKHLRKLSADLNCSQQEILMQALDGWLREQGTSVAALVERDARDDAARFSLTSLCANKNGRLNLLDLRAAYRAWCGERKITPLPSEEIGAALSSLFASVGYYRHGEGNDAYIAGVELSSKPSEQSENRQPLVRRRKART